MFKILVFGRNFEGLDSFGGWQVVWRSSCLVNAEIALKGLIAMYGEDNVDTNWG